MEPIHLAAAVLVATVLGATRSRWPSRSILDTFGAGFVPYRPETGWPRGVQEEEPRPWRTAPAPRPAEDRAAEPALDDVRRVAVRRGGVRSGGGRHPGR